MEHLKENHHKIVLLVCLSLAALLLLGRAFVSESYAIAEFAERNGIPQSHAQTEYYKNFRGY